MTLKTFNWWAVGISIVTPLVTFPFFTTPSFALYRSTETFPIMVFVHITFLGLGIFVAICETGHEKLKQARRDSCGRY